MLTWAKIAVIALSIFLCAGTVALCDITIIGEIKKLRNTIDKFSALLMKEYEKN